jgi:hypothetical protein
MADTTTTRALKGPQANFLVRLLVVLFALTYVSYALYFVVDTWIHNGRILRCVLGLDGRAALSPLFVACVHAVVGSVLGAGVLDLVSFHKYVAVEKNFEKAHVWGYFIGPWLAAALGLIVFGLLQSGLLILSGGAGDSSNSEVRNLGFLAIGFLSGFGWNDVTRRLQQIVRRFFSESLGARDDERGRPMRGEEAQGPAAGSEAPAASVGVTTNDVPGDDAAQQGAAADRQGPHSDRPR